MLRKSKNKLGLNLNLAPSTPDESEKELPGKAETQDDQDERQVQLFLLKKEKVGAEMRARDFDYRDDIGHGSSGHVTKVIHKPTGLVMARKLIPLDEKTSKQVARELQNLHNCNSPFIVGFYNVVHSGNGTDINIYMEYMNGGSLNHVMKKVGRFSEDILGKVTIAVISGVKYLYEKHRVIHRDIKPSNILINSDGKIKLCDLGVSRQLINSTANTFVGTQTYMAPERVNANDYSVKSDLWSLGLSLVELALGRYPIPPPSDDELQNIFGPQYNPMLEPPQPARSQSSNATDHNGPLSIFAYIQYIVNEPMPTIPVSCFSPEFKQFVDACLEKVESNRPDYKALENFEYYKRSDKEKVDVGGWVEQSI